MMRKVRVEDAGDAEVLPGSVMDWLEFEDYNNKVQARIDAGEEGLRLAVAEPTLMGITKHPSQPIPGCPLHPSRRPLAC